MGERTDLQLPKILSQPQAGAQTQRAGDGRHSARKPSPRTERQDRSASPPSHLSLPTHPLQSGCVAPTYLHPLPGESLKIPSPAGLTNAGFVFGRLSASATQCHERRVLAAATAEAGQGGRAAANPFGEPGGGKANLQLAGLHSGGGGFLPDPNARTYLGGKSKEN